MPLRHDIRRGVLLMLGACALFTLMSALIKALGDRIPVAEIMFFRSALAVPVVLLVVARARPGRPVWQALRTSRFPAHLVRAGTGTSAQACSFYALALLPLAEHTALTNTTPIFITLLSIPFLGEKVGIHRAGAVLLGFLGIVVIALGQGAFGGGLQGVAQIGVAAAVAQGVFSACTTLLVRNLSATEASTTITLWQSLLMTAFAGVVLPFVWVTPAWWELGVLILVGLLGGAAQVMLTEAWASAEVSALAPYSYSSLLWAILFGWIAFGDVPGFATIAGALLIVIASLYILHRELMRRRRGQ
ncbi:multidrug transporter [Falsiroseomonas bella]|uniref:Multidrug transporter n=1 Tax=Falsiroseomonas bella TaxID=2184016 RepID=A0A317FG45_9PROT|nr:DMT family transporter [Falsiroseomonas bella]PWS38050.1 multidrug transporter [Falsiroseomonas bella]